MADKYIVTYTDNSHGKSQTGLTKEWSFDKDASATIEKDTKKLIWDWKKENGIIITDFHRHYADLGDGGMTEREDLGGEQ